MAKNAGIMRMEIYIPKLCITQSDFELHNNCNGKYTVGLGQEKMAFCSDLEDINSMCLTVVKHLMHRNQIHPSQIGFLQVGTETIIDKSKSTKSELMALFEEYGVYDIEGIDEKCACFGGTAALFSALNWLESSSWSSGKFAIVVAGDIAAYDKSDARATGGAGAVAMLLGENAPLIVDQGVRSHFMKNVYDFHKPILNSEYPVVHGSLSLESYWRASLACYRTFQAKFSAANDGYVASVDSNHVDFLCFHTPFARLVQKTFGRLYLDDCFNGVLRNDDLTELASLSFSETLHNKEFDKVMLKVTERLFKKKVEPSLYIAKQVGNMYTASLYAALLSVLYHFRHTSDELVGKRILLFSYGSGCASAMYSISVTKNTELLREFLNSLPNVESMLSGRTVASITEFLRHIEDREKVTYKSFTSTNLTEKCVSPETFYLAEIDEEFRRYYTFSPS